MMPKWNDIVRDYPFWVSALNKVMFISDLPALRGPSIYIVSDYAGEQKDINYLTYSFLFCDVKSSQTWFKESKQLRLNFNLGKRKMGYKTLNDGIQKNALNDFLNKANSIEGILMSFAVNKNITQYIDDFGSMEKWKKIIELKANWKAKEFERMTRIVHFVSVLMAGLLKTGQNVYWISDQDNIFANSKYDSDVGAIIGKISGMYMKNLPGELGLGTTKIDNGEFIEEELASISDLAAGAVAEIVTNYSKRPEWEKPNNLTYFMEGLKQKTQEI
ncbi:MAG: hypothetical protein HUU01_11250, partial [Saprospiraceae bacterium]|nr:hypothetical protein [Saprospiraceae bacterium]